MDIISEKWQNRWNSEEVRILVLASLSIQIGLIFLAPLRKRSANKVLMLTLWVLYLTAEIVPTLALGNISKRPDPAESGHSGTMPGELTTLWAPFLLLHLAGPDSITSYSIDDNELWWRHPFGLVLQFIAAVYAFSLSPPDPGLWIPTILVCIVGLIKFVERTLALRSGSRNYTMDKILSELSPTESRKVYAMSEEESKRASESERESQLICEGFGWINIFRRLLVDVGFSQNLLTKSQERFSDISTRDALNLVAIELSFLYDILHTKAGYIHCTLGRVLRCFSLVSILTSLVVFHHLDMQKYSSKDIIITYILFGAGLSLEVIATVLLVFSDWTVVSLSRKHWSKHFINDITSLVKATLKNGKPRWSRTIGQYNLVYLCQRDKDTVCAWIMRKLKIKHKWDGMRETRFMPLTELLEEYMYNEATRRAHNVHFYNVLLEARSYRGTKALEQYGQLRDLEWSMHREFDECIILWHVATYICYYNEIYEITPNDNTEADVSWKTSNYMVYLLTQQQSMMQLGYGTKRFEATCYAIKKIFKGIRKLNHRNVNAVLMKSIDPEPVLELNDALVSDDRFQPRWKLLWVKIWVRLKGEKDKHKDEDKLGNLVLRDCLRLAKKLEELKPEIKWKLISETWMEMLGYAAIHCDSHQHAKSLSRGGELLTHFWLLMAQMGIIEEQKLQQFIYEYV